MGGGVVLPNVSVAKDAPKIVYYNPIPPMNIITYEASAKLTEVTNGYIGGLYINAFSGKNGRLTITSHTFENGVGTIEFDGDVTSIGNRAFLTCPGLTNITFPNSVTNIGEYAFYRCTGLKSITIPDSVTSIGMGAFFYCTGLTSVTIGSSVTSIDDSALQGCTGLTSIVVDSANTVYDSRDNCNALINTSTNELIAGCKNTVIPNTVTSIGNAAFDSCSGLTSITIPDSVTSIGSSAFSSCSELTIITCNAITAPTIQSNTFYFVKRGGTLTVPSGSSGYNVWMGTGNYYLGKYGWTKVEQ